MELNQYQAFTRTTVVYPKHDAISYTLYGLMSEIGEIADLFKKEIRDRKPTGDDTLIRELGDVLYYVARLSDELDYDLERVAQANINKLTDRQNRGTIHGSGDYR